MIETSRADMADSAGRLLKLSAACEGSKIESHRLRSEEHLHLAIRLLEADINTAIFNIRYALSKAPLHGRLIAVRQVPQAFSLRSQH